MQMWASGKLARFANNGNSFACSHKVSCLFEQYGVVLIYRNDIPRMLNSNYIPGFNCPACKNYSAVLHGFDSFIAFGNDIDTIMLLRRIKLAGEDTFNRCKEIQVRNTRFWFLISILIYK